MQLVSQKKLETALELPQLNSVLPPNQIKEIKDIDIKDKSTLQEQKNALAQRLQMHGDFFKQVAITDAKHLHEAYAHYKPSYMNYYVGYFMLTLCTLGSILWVGTQNVSPLVIASRGGNTINCETLSTLPSTWRYDDFGYINATDLINGVCKPLAYHCASALRYMFTPGFSKPLAGFFPKTRAPSPFGWLGVYCKDPADMDMWGMISITVGLVFGALLLCLLTCCCRCDSTDHRDKAKETDWKKALSTREIMQIKMGLFGNQNNTQQSSESRSEALTPDLP